MEIKIGGYTFEWNGLSDDSASMVLLDGSDGGDGGDGQEEYLDSAGLATWPTDAEVSAAVGRPVRFVDGGDHPDHPESIYEISHQGEYEADGWNELFTRDAYHAYGALDVSLPDGGQVTIGVIVGVPESQRGTADASGSQRNPSLTDAWYADSSDWETAGEEHRDGCLDAARAARGWLLDDADGMDHPDHPESIYEISHECDHRQGDGRATAEDLQRFEPGNECPACGCYLSRDGYWYIEELDA